MPHQLLATKLYLPPARRDAVRRPRLTRRLTEGLWRPLTLVSAPAGFGKTTLLSDYSTTLDAAGPKPGQVTKTHPMAWLSLDRGDNDPGRFWGYFLAALRTIPGLAAALPDELDAGAPPELLLAPLINGLEAESPGATGVGTTMPPAARPAPIILALDDYHVIQAPAIHAAVSYLVEHIPAGLRLVILTRSDPPWPLARLRANGLMTELRADDLRFSPDEAAEFLTRAMGLLLTAADIAALEERTEGWIAALQMAAISLEGHPDPHRFIAAFSGENRYIADYLAEEVIAAQPDPLRRFLLRSSILDQLSAPLCDAVTGDGPGSGGDSTADTGHTDSRALLEQAERRGLFLIPLDGERHWFRFHHLFRDLLRTRLLQTEPDLVPALHIRASTWLAANGFTLEAAGHSVAARHFERAAELVEKHAGNWWALAHSMFLDLIMKLPPEVTGRRPVFCMYQAWLNCITGRLDEAFALVEATERLPEVPSDIRSFLVTMRAYISELTGRPYSFTDAVIQALDYIPEDSVAMRGSADVIVAYVLQMNERFEEAATILHRAAEREVAGDTTNAIPIAISRLARMRLIQGRVTEAADFCRHYYSIIKKRGAARFYIGGNLPAVLADALRLQGDLAGAERYAQEGVQLNGAWPIPNGVAMAMQSLARVHFAKGDAAGALDLLEREEATIRDRMLPHDLVSDRLALRVQAWLALGNLEPVKRWALESGLTPRDPLSYRRETEHITLARVLLAGGREEEVAEGKALAARLAAAAEAAGRLGRLEEIRGLSRAERLGGASGGEPTAQTYDGILSERELEILGLLAKGCSNSEMAGTLIVAVGTVKTHIHNIFRKLGATNRTGAVARARDLGLLR